LAPPETEEDPAVYRSSRSKTRASEDGKDVQTGKTKDADGVKPKPNIGSHNGPHNGHDRSTDDSADEADEDMSDGDDQDDGALLTVQPGFNRLLLVLRDERVMRFVKYLSASAPGCRWDVYGEWEVGIVEDDSEEESV
jgi:hypothetical protein